MKVWCGKVMQKAGLYDKIRPQVNRRHWKLPMLVGICVCTLTVVMALGVWAVKYHNDYMDFVAKLSESTNYAYKHNCLQAEIDGKLLRISGENAYHIYTYITVYGSGRTERRVLDEADSVLLNYGNGMTLRLWELPKEEEKKSRLYLLFEDAAGDQYSYSTDEVSLDSIKVRYLTLRDNEYWE